MSFLEYLGVFSGICAFFVRLHFFLISCIFLGFRLFTLFSHWVLGGGHLHLRVEGREVRWRLARGRCRAGTGLGVAWGASGGWGVWVLWGALCGVFRGVSRAHPLASE